jgi:hypothetical protein
MEGTMDDLMEQSRQGKRSLLTLARSDLESSSPPLVLLQLPAGWSVDDLRGAGFRRAFETDDQPPNNATATLVSDVHGTSFDLVRVETSNTLLVVPPPTKVALSNKRCKLEARVLCQPGGSSCSGASFWQARPRPWPRRIWSDWRSMLLYAESSQGRTVSELAAHCGVSRPQVHEALRMLAAVALPSAKEVSYVVLSESLRYEVEDALVAALAEMEMDYATSGIPVEAVVEHLRQTTKTEEQLEHFARQVLAQWAIAPSSEDGTIGPEALPDRIHVDITKVREPRQRHFCLRSLSYQCVCFRWHNVWLVDCSNAPTSGKNRRYWCVGKRKCRASVLPIKSIRTCCRAWPIRRSRMDNATGTIGPALGPYRRPRNFLPRPLAPRASGAARNCRRTWCA